MKRSTDRMLSTHVGSLPRATELLDMVQARLRDAGGMRPCVGTRTREEP